MIDFDTELWRIEDAGWEIQHHNILNRALVFGDGLFETMVFTRNSIRFSQFHQERLLEGCKVLGLESKRISRVEALQNKILNSFGPEKQWRIRWIVFRAGLGKYTPETNQAIQLIQIQPLSKTIKIKSKGYISKNITVPASPWSHCKTLNALTYVMANIEKADLKMDEVILLSSKGFISEAGSSNIFWIKDGKYFTPSLSCNGIAGIGRRVIINCLRSEGITISEGQFLPQELLDAQQVFTSNVTGISYIHKIGDTVFDVKEMVFLERLFIYG